MKLQFDYAYNTAGRLISRTETESTGNIRTVLFTYHGNGVSSSDTQSRQLNIQIDLIFLNKKKTTSKNDLFSQQSLEVALNKLPDLNVAGKGGYLKFSKM